MRESVAKLYPVSDSEKHKPPAEQHSQLPDDLVDLIDCSTSERRTKMVQLIREKSSTPGDGGKAPSDCLWQHRPHAVSAGISTGAIGDPSAARMGAIMQHGKIEVQTGHTLISQWESKYISQVCHLSSHLWFLVQITASTRKRTDGAVATIPDGQWLL